MRSAASALPRRLISEEASALPKCTWRIALGAQRLRAIVACDRSENPVWRGVARNPDSNSASRPAPLNSAKLRPNRRGAGNPSPHAGSRRVEGRGARPPPAGVNTASITKRLVSPPSSDQLPRLDALIIVEGHNDCTAVHRAIRAPVYVLGGGYTLAEEMKPELRHLAELAATEQLPRQIVVFTDPDWQGRMFRTYLDDLLSQPDPASGRQQHPAGVKDRQQQQPERAEAMRGAAAAGRKGLVVRHAFLRVELGTSDVASRYHEAGNVGVEHASPDTVRRCLVRARPGFGPGRTEFSVEQLRADGLVGSWDDKGQVAGPQLRRGRFCRALGIDEVGTGKALVNLLNRFFTREEYEAALKVATSAEP